MSGAKIKMEKQHPLKITLLDLQQLESNLGWLDGLESWKKFHDDILIRIEVVDAVLKKHQGEKQ